MQGERKKTYTAQKLPLKLSGRAPNFKDKAKKKKKKNYKQLAPNQSSSNIECSWKYLGIE